MEPIEPDWAGPELALSQASKVGRHVYLFGGATPQLFAGHHGMSNLLLRLNLDDFQWLVYEVRSKSFKPTVAGGRRVLSVAASVFSCGACV